MQKNKPRVIIFVPFPMNKTSMYFNKSVHNKTKKMYLKGVNIGMQHGITPLFTNLLNTFYL